MQAILRVHNDVMHLKGLLERSKPFGARRCPALATGIERKLECRDQAHHLGARGGVRQARPGTQRRLVETVERGEPAWEKLAIDHALGEPVGAAKAQSRCELAEPLADQALVARSKHGEAVA